MMKIKQLVGKVPGAYFGMAGVIEVVVLLEIATVLYSLTFPFNFFSCWVSSIGVGPNGATLSWSGVIC